MKLLKNKYFIGVVCIVMALLIAFVIIPKNSQEKTERILQMNQNVSQNTKLTESMVKSVEVPASIVTKDMVKDVAEVEGKYTTAAIFAGDYITTSKVNDVSTGANLYDLEEGLYAISVTVPNLASSVSAKIMTGDFISLYGYKNNNEAGIGNFPNVVQYEDLMSVKVLAITNSESVDTDAAQMEEDGNVIPATLVLEVNEKQIKEIIELENTCKLTAVFVKRGEQAKSSATGVPENTENKEENKTGTK